MREILLRGRVKKSDDAKRLGKWVVGYCCPSPYSTKHFSLAICPINSVQSGKWELIEIIPNTLGEYSGAKDKAGKRIFEGDLVEYYWGATCKRPQKILTKVEFFESEFLLIPTKKYEFKTWRMKIGYDKLEIVGNIYDNPELLKED